VFIEVIEGSNSAHRAQEGISPPGRPKAETAPMGGSEDTPVPSVGAKIVPPGRPKAERAPPGSNEDTSMPSVGANSP